MGASDGTARYALYYAPEPGSALWRFGSGVIGYDAATGLRVPFLIPSAIDPASWQAATEDPRRYGFHATLKAPFRLIGSADEIDLISEVARFAATRPSAPVGPCEVRVVDEAFVAFTPNGSSSALDALENAVVTHFDRFRAPLSAEEIERRRPERLTPNQRAHLDRWGYPYVFDEFRFHMTLTGRLPNAADVASSLARVWRAFRDSSAVTVDRLALFRQVPGENFRIIATAPLMPPEGALDGPSEHH